MPHLPGEPPLTITLRRSARARRFSLRVSRLDGRITLSLPPSARESEAMAFLRAQEGWLRRALAGLAPQIPVGPGALIPVEGRLLRLVPATGRLIRIEGDDLMIPGDPALAGAAVRGYLRHLARERLTAASDRHAAALGRAYARITLRDVRSRWGSCTADGALMYSWRLVMAPPAVLDYVAAHEVAHLAQMNHSPAFWVVVARLVPQYKAHRRWLRESGQALHGYRFAPKGD
jgi:predicted metal-dependent hydrolase